MSSAFNGESNNHNFECFEVISLAFANFCRLTAIRGRCACVNLYNRKYSNSPTVLERVGLEHEREANAANVLAKTQINIGKWRLSRRKTIEIRRNTKI